MQSQSFEPFAAASCHDDRQGTAGQAADVASGVGPSSVSHTVSWRGHDQIPELPFGRAPSVPHSAMRRTSFFAIEFAFARLAPWSPLKLCILSSEIVPFAKTGGLADVVGALVREFAQSGHEVRAFMPLYAAVRRAHPDCSRCSDCKM